MKLIGILIQICCTSASTSTSIKGAPPQSIQKKATEIASELRGTSTYLVGINSRIKTFLGKFIADALRYYFFDSDSLIEEAAGGGSVSKQFREYGVGGQSWSSSLELVRGWWTELVLSSSLMTVSCFLVAIAFFLEALVISFSLGL